MKTSTIITAIILATGISAKAQFELGLTAIPSLSTYHAEAPMYEHIFPFNYGMNINYRHNNFIFSTGLFHLTQGTKFQVEESSESNPEGTGEFFDIYHRAKAVTVPLIVNYQFIERAKSSFFGGIGIYAGYIYAQELENTSIPKDWQPDPSINYPTPKGRYTDHDVFIDLYLGINFGLGWKQKLSDKLSLQLRPNFLYQLREEQPKTSNAYTQRMMTWSLDVGIYYRIGKK